MTGRQERIFTFTIQPPITDATQRLIFAQTSDLILIGCRDLKQTHDQDQIRRLREYQPLRGVSDRWLYGEREDPLLPPGHRSAVLGLQSGSAKKYKGPLSLHFFYLNVGSSGHPWPVRVEIPKWVAEDKQKLDLLHCVLIEQCNMMGSKPYPYLLHRAHETAVVRREEKDQVEQLLALELRRIREEVGDQSHKDSAKALPGRTRTKR